ncbi:MAG: SagB/ThcOx family dehydrogenase [Atribacterota bacterium]
MKELAILTFFLVFFLTEMAWAQGKIALPEPKTKGEMSVEEALFRRRSVRNFLDEALTVPELSQLLFAAQGVTEKIYGFRTTPSAGALYPLELYVVVGKVEGIIPGVYRYHPRDHAIEMVTEGDRRTELFHSALSQESIREAPVTLLLSAVYERTTRRYGERGIRYVHMEVGHAAQNVYLEAQALGLGTVAIGAFRDEEVTQIVQLPRNQLPLYLMPVGRPKNGH